MDTLKSRPSINKKNPDISSTLSMDRSGSLAGSCAPSTQATNLTSSTTWSQLFLRNNWIDTGFDIDKDEEETVTCLEVMKYIHYSALNNTKRFLRTIWQRPAIMLYTLLTFFLLAGCGMCIIYSYKISYETYKKEFAMNIAKESALYFRDELAKTMIPLFSLAQLVKHDEYFRSLSNNIGTLGAADSAPVDPNKIGYRDVTGICDKSELVDEFDKIVESLKQDAQLVSSKGIITNIELAPMGVFCLSSPRVNYQDFENGLYQDTTGMIGKDWASPHASAMDIETLHSALERTSQSNPLTFNGPFKYVMSDDVNKVLSKKMFCVHLSVSTSDDEETEIKVKGSSYRSWGLVQAWINWDVMMSQSKDVIHDMLFSDGTDIIFKLTRSDSIDNIISKSEEQVKTFSDGHILKTDEDEEPSYITLASSPNSNQITESNSISYPIETLDSQWVMTVGYINGFSPPWYAWAIVGVAVSSFLFSLLLLVILVEKHQHRSLLYKMLPKNAVQKLNKGKTVVEKFNMVTIFFSDIVGFTTLAGSMRPTEVMKMLNDLYVEFDKLVEKHKLYKVETIGDAYMVLGGAPTRCLSTEAAEKVALFALDAMEVVKKLRVKTSTGPDAQISIRAGIASGPVVAGVVGNAMPRYCLFGDTVNFASRMESTSVKMKIQCCDTTSYLLTNSPSKDFVLKERLDPDAEDGRAGVYVKGKGWEHTWWIKSSSQRRHSSVHSISGKYLLPHDIDVEKGVINECSENITGPVLGMTNDHSALIRQISTILNFRLHQLLVSRKDNLKSLSRTKLSSLIFTYVARIEELYNNVQYHNFKHAFHVTNSMSKLIDLIQTNNGDLPQGMNVDLTNDTFTHFCLLFAALVHDVRHRGMPNFVHVKLQDELATRYNNTSVMEKCSIEQAMSIFLESDFDVLRDALFTTNEDFVRFQQIVYSTILCTDIFNKQRMDVCKERWRLGFSTPSSESSLNGNNKQPKCNCHQHASGISNKYLFSGPLNSFEAAEENSINNIEINQLCPFFENCSDSPVECLQKSVFIEHMIQIADVAHNVQSWDIFLLFNYRLLEELYSCHKTGWMDDATTNWYTGQIQFFDEYVVPLCIRFQKCCRIYFGGVNNNCDILLEGVLRNRARWIKEGKEVCAVFEKSIRLGEGEEAVMSKLDISSPLNSPF